MRHFAILSLAIRPVESVIGVLWTDDLQAIGIAAPTPSFTRLLSGRRRFITTRLLAACTALLCLGLPVDHAAAQTKYRFVSIADSSGPLRPFLGRPISINNHGDVAFGAFEGSSNNINGIFVGNGASTTTIAHTNGPYSNLWASDLGPDINDSGAVVFTASLDGGGGGLFVGDGVTTTSLPGEGSFLRPQINKRGQIAYWGRIEGVNGLYIWDGIHAELVAPWSAGPGQLSISDDGSVSYIDRIQMRISRIEGDTVSTIIESGAMVDFGPYKARLDRVHTHSRNANGATAFIGNVLTELGIYIVKDGAVTRVADHVGPLRPSEWDSIAINDGGIVAFLGSTHRRGIHTGGNLATEEVIGIGDSLFGSTLSHLQDYVDINNRGDIVFQYALANHVYGVAVARVVPEPEPMLLLIAALAAFVVPYACRTPRTSASSVESRTSG